MRLLFIFLSTLILSSGIALLIAYIQISSPWPAHAGVDERGMAYVFLLGINIALVLASSTIFLNLIEKIRNETLYSFFSFFALPIILTVNILSIVGFSVSYAIVFWPFFVVLTLHFIFYRKYVNAKLSLKDKI
ncbi:hypothetical protein GM921_14455 [Pedobacter sp. LMG 31464]|uniref:Uncharacterized protein n=1 Tax=Pedobacter planticolens TaxID=2679964 RepID=A0A923DZ29_9SPHI|nr:hypothetical protein [Pedobacter planticolens]MBB2146702.1 hypothetical protein [Pedobacter planticolens]